MFAALPMYDWLEVRDATDAFWSAIRAELRLADIAAPGNLNRTVPVHDGWLRDDLVLGQTCGLPYVRMLRGRVQLVGALGYDLPGVPAGDNVSRIVVRNDQPAKNIEDLRGLTVAYNLPGSQSGAAVLRNLVAPLAVDGRFFGKAVCTGLHAVSIRLVAAGGADVAAIDAVSWKLAERHMPEAAQLRVMASTKPTPGLPLITGNAQPATIVAEAVGAAVASMSQDVRDALMITGFLPRSDNDFDGIAHDDAAARRSGYTQLEDDPAF